jgi:hypothetical protein
VPMTGQKCRFLRPLDRDRGSRTPARITQAPTPPADRGVHRLRRRLGAGVGPAPESTICHIDGQPRTRAQVSAKARPRGAVRGQGQDRAQFERLQG